MNSRQQTVVNTRSFVLSVCAVVGVGVILTLTNADKFPLLKISATAFGLAILLAIVHIGVLWWKELYMPNTEDDNIRFFSFRFRGKFSLLLFIVLIAAGLIPVIFHAATV